MPHKILSFCAFFFFFTQCQPKKEQLITDIPQKMTGKELAAIHCGNCHLQPQPENLPKSVWKVGVLPNMAWRVGIHSEKNPLEGLSIEENLRVEQAHVFLEKAVLSDSAWAKIKDYYIENAPQSLARHPKNALKLPQNALFSPLSVPIDEQRAPNCTVVRYDSLTHSFWVGSMNNTIYRIGNNYKVLDFFPVPNPVVEISPSKEALSLLSIGKVLNPNESKMGVLVSKQGQNGRKILENLSRPVHFVAADLNKNGETDYIVCEFGYLTGALTWYEPQTNQPPKKTTLENRAGARVAQVMDFDKDGWQDVVALMTQGREQIVVYLNKKDHFEPLVLQEFIPEYGSSYLELQDFNKDGFIDILYTNGDNADFSVCKKPYHGVHILMNDGKNGFKEAWFYPINGASKAVARDFDLDGDLDIAVISYFPDDEKSLFEGFMFFEQRKSLVFAASTLPIEKKGKWMVMDVGDMDGDGDEDIMLGSNTAFVPTSLRDDLVKKGNLCLILKNNVKQ